MADVSLKLINKLLLLKPREYVSDVSAMKTWIGTRLLWLTSDRNVKEFISTELYEEEEQMKAIKKNEAVFEKSLQVFLDSQLEQRRHRMFQRELNARKVRVLELREARLKALVAEKEKEEEVELEKEERRKIEAEKKKQPSRVSAHCRQH